MSCRRSRAFAICLMASIALFSCQKKTAAIEPDERPQDDTVVSGRPIGGEKKKAEARVSKLDSGDFADYAFDTKPLRAEAHKNYLADPLAFQPLPDQSVPAGATAVVGSRVCLLYPNAALEKAADLEKLPPGMPIPFGTIIPIKGEKIADPQNADRYGMFSFQENWNWFYRTTYEGKDGLVFGADLYGLDDTNEANRVSARLYQTGGKYDAFHPVVGYRELPKEITTRLERDRLAFQAVREDEYDLNGSSSDLMPDDMIALYSKHRDAYARNEWNRKTPMFVTTDLAAHAQHLMFDRTLQYLEEFSFLPRLKALNEAFLSTLKAREAEAGEYRETLEKALRYFQTAQALLDLAPDLVAIEADKWGGREESYAEKDRDSILSSYPVEVREEIAKIDRAEGFENSSVFAFKNGTQAREDYSQYKPRGHYTKNGALAAYFRAMMWFGRIHFLIAEAGPSPLETANGKSSDSTALTLSMEPIALLIVDAVQGDEKLFQSWSDLFDPITALIGLSDDLSIKEILPLWKEVGVDKGDFGAWAGNKENLLAFMRTAHEKLKPPAISGSSVWWGPSEGSGTMIVEGEALSLDRKAPMGWRLFGQRFTYDSAIHQHVSPPRLMSRNMVRGIDIMKVFGSSAAESLLQASDYPRMAGLKQKLDELEREFASYDTGFWKQTYYNSVLFQVKAQAQFEAGSGFYFTESPAWGIKAMLSSHGTWSELRHDTILYAKQNVAERAGDGDFAPTFRTAKIPEPIHYLEPNLAFWQASTVSIEKFLKTLDAYGLLDEESARSFRRLREIFAKASEIAAAEILDKPISANDNAWIAKIPAELVHLVMIHVKGANIEDEDQLKMAIVADVFTNAELGLVLETGVGIPYRIYVPLNDGQGGKRIAIGYVFSYYEFQLPMGERMTDEKWKKIVYDPNADLDKYRPFWSKGILAPPEPVRKGK